jgi:heme oxygenase (biliverdin-IX-beta and delta-forming)
MLDVQLKEHTRDKHALLEKLLLGRITNIAEVSDYVALLSLLYGYYAAIENELTLYLRDSSHADFLSRRKADKILGDIALHAPGHKKPPLCARLPEVSSFHTALGVLYVLEGSTLGGRIIAQLISRKLNVAAGLNFFLSYGDEVDKMWASFKAVLREPFTREQESEVIAGAIETFETFYYWMSEHE